MVGDKCSSAGLSTFRYGFLRSLLLISCLLICVHGFSVPSRLETSLSSRSLSRVEKLDTMQVRPNQLRSSSLTSTVSAIDLNSELTERQKMLTKFGMTLYISAAAISFMTSLSILKLMGSLGLPKLRKERWSLRSSTFIARWLLRLIPFCKMNVINAEEGDPEPTIWVCNHTSMLDVFLMLAADRKMRGKKRRPMKIVYWKQLEDNPFTKIVFQQCGFIPVQMKANKPGEANEYDRKGFKPFLKAVKQAFADGFDVGILPEGQLNPTPEKGLMPIFSGATTLAKMSGRPIQMIAMHGANQLWHPNDGFAINDAKISGRKVSFRVYPAGRKYSNQEEFAATFENVVGEFGKNGEDAKSWKEWVDGTEWERMEAAKQVAEEKESQVS